jgi:hypothetical protein
VKLEGSLDAFSLADVFGLLSMTKKTGALHLTRSPDHGVVWLEDGIVVGASQATGPATLPDGADLARRAVATAPAGDISPGEIAQLAAGCESGMTLLTTLRDRGLLDPTGLAEVAAEHAVDVVFALSRWTDGDFRFEVEAPRGWALVSQPADGLLAAACERVGEWDRVARSLPASDTVLHLSTAAAAAAGLSSEQWLFVALADGSRTVADLVTASGRGEFAAGRCLAELVTAGVLTREPDAGVAAHLARLAAVDGDALAVVPDQAVTAAAEPAVVDECQPPAAPAPADFTFEAVTIEELAEPAPTPPLIAAEQLMSVAAGQHPAEGSRPLTVGALAMSEPDIDPLYNSVSELASESGPVPALDRDPDVNKSLLLRLIAGVRGL